MKAHLLTAALAFVPGCKTRGAGESALAAEESARVRASGAASSATPIPNAWLEIDLAAFESNVRTMLALLGPTKLCAVVKADAYGHGLALVMPVLVRLGVPCVAITSNEEAQLVRQSGYDKMLLRIRTATLAEIRQALAFDVEESLGNLELARSAATAAMQAGKVLRVHVALNSGGMSRNGLELSSEEGKRDAVALAKLPGLSVVGLMTHFAVEDKADVKKGLATFQSETAWLIEAARLDRAALVVHAANSYATLEVPESRLDMARVGGALYGDTLPTYVEYERVMAFKTRVASVNTYPAGNTVSYDRTAKLQRASRLANLPVGYADGYRRAFTNKASVLIRGVRRPIVGRVTMNTVMVDVTDDPAVKAGDEVVLFGKQGAAAITQPEMETMADSILADLYTIWGTSNPRVPKAPSTP